jgi:hypothetical protein
MFVPPEGSFPDNQVPGRIIRGKLWGHFRQCKVL